MDAHFDQEIFSRKKPVPEKLEAFGFRKRGNFYAFETDILEGDFRLQVTFTDGNVSTTVIDRDTGEAYLPLHLETAAGGFVGKVREACAQVLEQIASRCCADLFFVSDQANRLMAYAAEKYGDTPDFPFSQGRYTGDGVLRNPQNQKWYAVVLRIPENKLNGGKTDALIDILNLKIREEDGPALVQEKGIYPAYHMNHKSWITIRLDDTVPDERIEQLMDISRSFTENRCPTQRKAGKNAEWIIPSNLAYYDIISEYEKRDHTSWRQYRNMDAGDIVYIYVGVPYKAILYRCEVLKAHIPDKTESCGERMEMKITDHYPNDLCTREGILKEYGVTNVRGPRYVPVELSEFLEKHRI